MSFLPNMAARLLAGLLGAALLAAPAAAQDRAAPRAESPIAAEVLSAAAPLPRIAALYAPRGGEPFWSVAGGRMPAEALVAALETAGGHALPAARYGLEGLRARLAERGDLPPARVAQLEVELTRALTRFAADLSAGLLVPNEVDGEINVFPVRPEPDLLMLQAEGAPDLRRWLAAVAPQDPGYGALRETYARLKREARAGGWRAALSEGGTLRPGDAGPRVAQLRARLEELGDAAPRTDRPELYDAGLERAVRTFQRRHGLNTDGLAGRRTFAALGADVGWRLRQVAVNLERMRWLQHAPRDPRRIEVNIPDYRMRLIANGEVLHDVRAIVGQRRHRTPEFTDVMTYLVVNPTWHVPRSIATQEILPALKEDPAYLLDRNMRLVATDGGPVPEDHLSHDWSQYDPGFFPYRVKQGPGDDNSLGRVKFMFPNQFSIYLHDTPGKRLFRRDGRAFSHGCVRVEDPFRLAHLLLAPQLTDPEATFAAWLADGRERYVNLDEPVQVRIDYRTAWVDADGRAQFREDIYGRDAAVWGALEAEGLGVVGL
jgi:murein L,D-transpeptidase YcbB/YkuD